MFPINSCPTWHRAAGGHWEGCTAPAASASSNAELWLPFYYWKDKIFFSQWSKRSSLHLLPTQKAEAQHQLLTLLIWAETIRSTRVLWGFKWKFLHSQQKFLKVVRKVLQCQCHHPQPGPEQQVWCLVMHLPVVLLLAETGSAKLGPRKVQAAAGHELWLLALQTAQACPCWGVLTWLALPKHKAELESQHRIFILEKTWVWPFQTCHKKANTWGSLKVSLKERLWKQWCSAKIHVGCQVYKILLQHTIREWFSVYSNKPSLLNAVKSKIRFIIHAIIYEESYAHMHSGGKPHLFQIIKHFAISLNLKNILQLQKDTHLKRPLLQSV